MSKQSDFERQFAEYNDNTPYPGWQEYQHGDKVAYLDDSMSLRFGTVSKVGDITICGGGHSSLWEKNPKGIYVGPTWCGSYQAIPLRFIRKMERAEELRRFVDGLTKMVMDMENLSVLNMAVRNMKEEEKRQGRDYSSFLEGV